MKPEPKKIEPEEYKTIIKDVLRCVHRVCVENNIRYFAAYGTLLGAVRHGGIIPWDDDIDIWMPAEDYDRFVDVFAKSAPDYYILNGDTSPYYYHLVTRVCSRAGILKMKGIADIDDFGPFIDIFPLYKAPEDPAERMALYKAVKTANYDVRYSLPLRYYRTCTPRGRLSALKNCLKRLGKRLFVGTKKLKEIRKAALTRYENTDSDLYYAAFDYRVLTDKRIFTKEQIEDRVLHRFEEFEIFIPRDYDTILTRIYGDYMQLPPPEKRVTKHHFTPYWRETAD